MIEYADVIVDLQAGDTGKGKVAHSLANTPNEYTHIIRYNGGGNAGHTIYHNGQKIVTHFIPCGVLFGIKSIIGPGCVVDPVKLVEEAKQLESLGFDVKGNLFVDIRSHIITDAHKLEDSKDNIIGTTKTGNGPAYEHKYGRAGIRAENCPELEELLIDIYDELHGKEPVKVLFEGAQGFELDIDWGDYPYVTSSHCMVGGAILNGVPPQKVRKVYGVAKAYRTYVGNKQFELSNPIFDKIREVGGEYGATTGRKRQIGWTDIDMLIKSIRLNGVTDLVVNKLDVLEQIDIFPLIYSDTLINFSSSDEFCKYFLQKITENCETIERITFSKTPHNI
ncbi:adenylosuccinate synthetase [uncultured Caudovirales phage]|uniref:Adenylosuccinate synthetase n=1 Tax=uncultured Caudovirales phage TaxID=2100421 RepID=A0A6J5MF83_9CAUD|nr:adenylosuccinate synthetase [uncultured Caudovirales phage]